MQHRDAVLVVLLACACGSREEPSSLNPPAVAPRREPTAPAPPAPEPVAKGAPHGGQIRLLAVTEQGDAALTIDELEGMRLWPSLDGSRPPVPVHVSSSAAQLALVRDGRELVAIVRDAAGSVQLTRVGRDGSIRGRAQLSGGPSYAEVVTVADQILARTTDHALELYALDGTLRGRIQGAHGELITDVAARGGRAAAVVYTGESHDLRWLATTDKLGWDVSHRLPLTPDDDMLAIAPSRRRIAFVDAAHTGVYVLDVDLMPVRVPGQTIPVNQGHHTIGFIDDDHVGIASTGIAWWGRDMPSTDPWAVPPTPPTGMLATAQAAAFAEGRVVTPFNLSLAITDTVRTRYLGWKDSGQGTLAPAGNDIVLLTSGYQFTWLDGNLALKRKLDLQATRQPSDPWAYGQAIGQRHVLAQKYKSGGTTLELFDSERPGEPIVIGTFKELDRYEYADGFLAVIERNKINRYRVDLDANTVTEIKPALSTSGYSLSWLRLFDPERADGLVAAMQGWPSEYAETQTLTIFRKVGKRIVKSRVKRIEANLLRSDATGKLYLLDYSQGTALTIMHGTKVLSRLERPQLSTPVAISDDGMRFALKSVHEIVMVDDTGKELWRQSLWGASSFTFADAGKRLVVAAPGGFIAFDAVTGEQLARECGWNFGLHDTPPEETSAGFAPVCEDPVVQ